MEVGAAQTQSRDMKEGEWNDVKRAGKKYGNGENAKNKKRKK